MTYMTYTEFLPLAVSQALDNNILEIIDHSYTCKPEFSKNCCQNCPVVGSHERWCRVDGVYRTQFTKFIEQYYPELFI